MLLTYIVYAYLLPTYLKTECSSYIAYIGQKEQKRKKVWMLLYVWWKEKQTAYKEKKLYIYIYSQEKKEGKIMLFLPHNKDEP